MANLIEKYAFITNASYALHGSQWPDARSIGANYKLIQYSSNQESKLESLVESLGFELKKELTSSEIIEKMNLNELGPFVCYISECRDVVNHFEPTQE